MDTTSAGIETELLDLSTVDVAALRSLPASDFETATERVRARIIDGEGSISGYSGSFSGEMRGDRPDPR
ncbi:hypothetical protein Ait01nite_024690 [Actinoplanes italicus]|uniref:Uncharacterized protein n=1 Tax=Actinoplanes italicus TaxID=113567 RepID=A0A2T0KFK5_9ACTN|nr:hypothetical protein [Actinoplanes italicus]PRX22157.1 hypothetical protein CLV67_105334 [Actinoplanes italicus]GIE29424.1 hypothetical protein Ait01nite_024690 [Actinoplanes italicus]